MNCKHENLCIRTPQVADFAHPILLYDCLDCGDEVMIDHTTGAKVSLEVTK